MKNKTVRYAVLGILFVLVSIIEFVIPTEKTASFWIAYIFTIIAFVIQIFFWKKSFEKGKTLKSKFLSIPVAYVSVVYLIIQIVAVTLFSIVPSTPIWSAVLCCAVVFCLSALCMIVGETGRKEIEQVDVKIQKKVSFIKELQVEVEELTEIEKDSDTKEALQQLAEKIRFSDPMSNDDLEDIENTITAKINELKTADDKMPVIRELNSLITDRNNKVKILK